MKNNSEKISLWVKNGWVKTPNLTVKIALLKGWARLPDQVSNQNPSHAVFGQNKLMWIDEFELAKRTYKRGMYEKSGSLYDIGRLVVCGYSNRHIAKQVGCHKNTVAKFRKIITTIRGEAKCKCGKPGNHRGLCHYRVMNSPKRIAFLKKWHSNTRRKIVKDRKFNLNKIPL